MENPFIVLVFGSYKMKLTKGCTKNPHNSNTYFNNNHAVSESGLGIAIRWC